MNASVRYRFAPDWSVTVRYVYDRRTEKDFRTNGLIPAPPPLATQGDVFLGSDTLPYRAGWLAITLGYHIGMPLRSLTSR